MKIFKTQEDLNPFITKLQEQKKSIGFVPTMGALHKGHLALVKKAIAENDIVVSSIYVNPLQFNNTDDFSSYPRFFDEDINLLKKEGCHVVFFPDNKIIAGAEEFHYEVGYLDTIMEGYYRPGHFKGVAYIVKKLFELVQPDKAYFGLKDYQQWVVINKMVRDFELPVELVPCETVREPGGLAMSSRNQQLSPQARKTANIIYQTLETIKEYSHKKNTEDLKKLFKDTINAIPQMQVEYIEICDAETLEPVNRWPQKKKCVACTAVFYHNVRLIDNIILF